jgi:hypothetical protein
VADPPDRWRALGFTVTKTTVRFGGVSIELGAAGRGITGWRLSGLRAVGAIDGLPTQLDDGDAPAGSDEHPNGAVGLDHVVVLTPDFDRTAAELARAGLPLRRVHQLSAGLRQGFRRLGPAILELVESPDAEGGPVRFWGLVVTVTDLDRLAADLGERLGTVKAAVQPGRQIATLRPSAGLGEAMAFMSPEPVRPSATLD